MNKPLISIGMPVYNGERFITETIESLLSQTFKAYEINICDNASTDATEEICRRFAESDSRIQYFRNSSNLGAAKNYRRAFELSSSKYFRWANCDDLFAPKSLQMCYEALEQDTDIVLTYPKTKFIDGNGGIIGDYDDDLHLVDADPSVRFRKVFENLGYVNVIYGLIRSDILRRTGLIRNFSGGDIPLIMELSLYGKFWEIPEPMFYRRFHENAYSSFKNVKDVQEFFDPKSKGKIPFREWRHLGSHFGSVLRSPLNLSDKIKICGFIIRIARYKSGRLLREIVFAVQNILKQTYTAGK
jgi:glycosyltransferase involved in cell wall biosynthesis